MDPGLRLPHPRHQVLRPRGLLHLVLPLRGAVGPRRPGIHDAGGRGRDRLLVPTEVGAACEPADMDGRRNSG